MLNSPKRGPRARRLNLIKSFTDSTLCVVENLTGAKLACQGEPKSAISKLNLLRCVWDCFEDGVHAKRNAISRNLLCRVFQPNFNFW